MHLPNFSHSSSSTSSSAPGVRHEEELHMDSQEDKRENVAWPTSSDSHDSTLRDLESLYCMMVLSISTSFTAIQALTCEGTWLGDRGVSVTSWQLLCMWLVML
eukprot:CAMPEP_0181311318 /NCGR_PEP_ID=MMETSP1101-20121128/13069_1 /TAXON_ID=46948 /ORGANISM="Rhodomonas abbreviata, Strain Caron Lab Isolate" /LENGTH=102 /DNA_ID=CAMNT_0023418033 /DNA_START=416 /DNA_END=724 /DNA_ORIENTATION=+